MSKAEELVNWYLRLNGLLTIPHFILHPSSRGPQRTDADIIGIRFPFRREFEKSDCDDRKLEYHSTKPSLFIVEVKTKEIDLNETWQNPEKGNINKILNDLGFFQTEEQAASVAEGLYNIGKHEGENYYCSLLFIGNVDLNRIPMKYSSVPRITWKDIIEFIHGRFCRFAKFKDNNEQWDQFGKKIYEFAKVNRSLPKFEAKLREYCLLPAA
jgi:hypothetical protein